METPILFVLLVLVPSVNFVFFFVLLVLVPALRHRRKIKELTNKMKELTNEMP